MKHLVLFSILFAVASTTTAFADELAGPPGSGVTVYSPHGWKTQAAQQGSEAILLSVAPTEEAGLFYAVVEAKNFDAATQGIDKILSLAIKDVKVEKAGKITVNGMPALAFGGKGTAVDNGKAVTLALVLLQPNADHVLFAVAMAQTDKKSAYKAEFDKALAGIKKSK